MTHICRSGLLQNKISILVVGAGGTGSLLATDLAKLQVALEERGHLGGMQVTVADGDTVSEANVARQSFYAPDVGHNKADILVNRINTCFGLNWRSHPQFLTEAGVGAHHIVISCVDSKKARRTVLKSFGRNCPWYWLDMGNKEHTGQIVLGEPLRPNQTDWEMRLPTVTELYPAILDETAEEDNAPSCSLAEALEKQGLFINRAMAMYGLQMIEHLIRYGSIEYSAVFVDLKRAKTSSLAVSKEAWAPMGYVPKGTGKRPTGHSIRNEYF